VNQQILRNTPVTTTVMPIDSGPSPTGSHGAVRRKKYGDEVRRSLHPGLQQRKLCGGHTRHPAPAISASSKSSPNPAFRPEGPAASKPSPEKAHPGTTTNPPKALHRIAGLLRVAEARNSSKHVDRLLAGKKRTPRASDHPAQGNASLTPPSRDLELRVKEKNGVKIPRRTGRRHGSPADALRCR